jgi:predicted acyltransferase
MALSSRPLTPRAAEQTSRPLNAPRADALDLLRGVAILLMVLSAAVPYGVLPAWMYHAQLPPPLHAHNPDLAGLTWVDLVFPFFLFALGAALPLAMEKRLAAGISVRDLLVQNTLRALRLFAFAIVLQHVRPGILSATPTAATYLAALAGFALLWALFLRVPRSWPERTTPVLRTLGVVGTAALLLLWPYSDASRPSLATFDIILVLLAVMVLVGGPLYLATRRRPALRWGTLVILAALILGAREPGPLADLHDARLLGGLFSLYYLKYLFLVVPGMVAGEALGAWIHTHRPEADDALSRWAGTLTVGVAVVLQIVVCAGLLARWPIWLTMGLSAVLWIVVAERYRMDEGRSATLRLVRTLWGWGGFWLLVGLLLEPYEGGIKKDWSTFSYYFVTGGLAHLLLAGLHVLTDRFGWRLRLVAASGANPMVAYVGLANLVVPVLGLTGLAGLIASWELSPWAGALVGLGWTLVVAAVAWWATERRLFWRT